MLVCLLGPDALGADLDDTPPGTTREGIHPGAMAGTIDIITRSFAGLRTDGDTRTFDPQLPAGLRGAQFQLHHRGERIHVSLVPTGLHLAAHQPRSLDELRRGAYARSPFCSRHHAGLFDAPLSELPPVTKEESMGHFDEVVTDPALHFGDIEDHLRALVDCGADPGRPWRGRWWAAATAGTTGRRGVWPASRDGPKTS